MFLAKAPLFDMPVLGYFVRAMDALPVHREQDEGGDVSKNSETFVAARNCSPVEARLVFVPKASHTMKSDCVQLILGLLG